MKSRSKVCTAIWEGPTTSWLSPNVFRLEIRSLEQGSDRSFAW